VALPQPIQLAGAHEAALGAEFAEKPRESGDRRVSGPEEDGDARVVGEWIRSRGVRPGEGTAPAVFARSGHVVSDVSRGNVRRA